MESKLENWSLKDAKRHCALNECDTACRFWSEKHRGCKLESYPQFWEVDGANGLTDKEIGICNILCVGRISRAEDSDIVELWNEIEGGEKVASIHCSRFPSVLPGDIIEIT